MKLLSRGGMNSNLVPKYCSNPDNNGAKCPPDSFMLVPELCTYIDSQ